MKKAFSLWHYVKEYRFNSIFTKYFFMIMFFIVIPLMMTTFYVYHYYNNVVKEEIEQSNINSLTRIRDTIDMISLEADRITLRLSADSEVEAFLTNTKENEKYTYAFLDNVSRVQKIITSSIITSDFIESIYIYADDKDYLITSDKGSGETWKFNDSWYKEYKNNYKNSTTWVSILKNENQIAFFRTAPFYSSYKRGTIVVNVDINKINKLTANNNRHEDIFIADKNNLIIYNQKYINIGTNIDKVDVLKDFKMEAGKISKLINNGSDKNVVAHVKSQYNDWRFISVTPLDKHEQKLHQLRKDIILLMLISLFIVVFVSFFISVRIYSPIKDLIKVVEESDYYMTSYDKKLKYNELSIIYQGMIKSFDSNKKMKEELSYRMGLLNKAMSIALQSQINPHFLFNTLENIRWKAMELTGGSNGCSKMISMLSNLLRISFETSNHLVSIEKELEHARLYLDIQKIRYEDKFDVKINISEEILKYKIPKITLQPLIENAIYHGIKPSKEKCLIEIESELKENNIVLKVKDDGIGMTEKEYKILNEDMCKDYIKENKHIGIKNVNQRIKLSFGVDYGLTLKSDVNVGTQVEIMIPRVE
jgi:two-component system, sensor histidine kinase YesM